MSIEVFRYYVIIFSFLFSTTEIERNSTSIGRKNASEKERKDNELEVGFDNTKTKIEIIYTNERETSVLLPTNCSFLTMFWCQIDNLGFNGVEYEGERSKRLQIGGGLQNWINAGRNELKQ